MTNDTEKRLQTLLKELAEEEARKVLPPSRPELVEQWAGRTIHARRALQVFGHSLQRGDWLTITEAMVTGSVDRAGHSVLDALEDSDAIGEGQHLPAGEELWQSDDDPRKEMIRRLEAEQLQREGASPARWREHHRRFETVAQRTQRQREEVREEARRKAGLSRWTA